MIDCLYLVGKYTKNKSVTQVSIMNTTKKLWGLCTSPRVHTWRPYFKEDIQEVVDVLNANNVDNEES